MTHHFHTWAELNVMSDPDAIGLCESCRVSEAERICIYCNYECCGVCSRPKKGGHGN